MSKIVACHQPNYIPWLGYFDKMSRVDLFILLDDVQLPLGRSWETRNRIRVRENWIWLTVPVKRKTKGKQLIKDVLIDHDQNWAQKHFRTISNSYGRTDYFKDHHDFLERLYCQPPSKLLEFNVQLILYLFQYLNLKTEIIYSSSLGVTTSGSHRLAALVNAVDGDEYLSGNGDTGYLEPRVLEEAGIKICNNNFIHPEYNQIHGGFIPEMSVIDAIFNLGAATRELLNKNAHADSQ